MFCSVRSIRVEVNHDSAATEDSRHLAKFGASFPLQSQMISGIQ